MVPSYYIWTCLVPAPAPVQGLPRPLAARREGRLLGRRRVLRGPDLQSPHPPRLCPPRGALSRLVPSAGHRALPGDAGGWPGASSREKGGKQREIPVRHDLDAWIAAYLEAGGIDLSPKAAPLFLAAERGGWG